MQRRIQTWVVRPLLLLVLFNLYFRAVIGAPPSTLSPKSSPSPSAAPPPASSSPPPTSSKPPSSSSSTAKSPSSSALPPSSPKTHAPSPSSPPESQAPTPSAEAPASPLPPAGRSNGTLDPAQAKALVQLGISAGTDPCNTAAQRNIICDQGSPYRHLIYLKLEYCTENQVFPSSVWANLTTLKTLEFSECPAKQMALPAALVSGLTALTVYRSLGRSVENVLAPGLSSVWLNKFHNLEKLTVQEVDVNASGLSIIIAEMPNLQELVFESANLTGALPKAWPQNLTQVQLSGNDLQGGIPSALTRLSQLTDLDLSSSNLSGGIPSALGNLSALQTLKLSSNRLRGPIPASLERLTGVTYLDLSSNQLNGSIPAYLSKWKGLRYLDLSKNNFRGEIPFNDTFLRSLNTFKARGNALLCYNSTRTSAKYVAGVEPCDASGLPAVGPASSSDLSPLSAPSPQPHVQQSSRHSGPKKIVLIVAIGLACIVAIIALAICISKCCSNKN